MKIKLPKNHIYKTMVTNKEVYVASRECIEYKCLRVHPTEKGFVCITRDNHGCPDLKDKIEVIKKVTRKVTLCKDCEYFHTKHFCSYFHEFMDTKDFCSKGVPRK